MGRTIIDRGCASRPLTRIELACALRLELVDLLQEGSTPVSDKGGVELALEGYGYRWLRVVSEGSRRLV